MLENRGVTKIGLRYRSAEVDDDDALAGTEEYEANWRKYRGQGDEREREEELDEEEAVREAVA